MKIIVVDDDPLIRLLLEQQLRLKGHTVLAYDSPLSCPLYKSRPCPCEASAPCPDIIITDFDMPHVNGVEFLKDVYSRGCKCTNVAIITAKGLDENDMRHISRLGTRFFIKPVDTRELYAWLDRVSQQAGVNASASLD